MIPGAVRIFVCTEAIDMRQGFDRLAQLVRSKLGEDPQTGSLRVRQSQRDEAQSALVRQQRLLPALQALAPRSVRPATFERRRIRAAQCGAACDTASR
jgi:hypothetical protein